MALHGGFNAAQQEFMGCFSGADSAHVQLLTAVGWAFAALVVIWHTGGSLAPNNRPP